MSKWSSEELAVHAEIRSALERGEHPPAAFLAAVASGEIPLPEDILDWLSVAGLLVRQRCEVWSRVMGYYRPVEQWNIGKKQEHADRVPIDPKKASIPPG